ncbi:hypothetical protein NSR00_14390 [Aeribacillus sp. FSL K6-8394]|uniref:hypothetical protein n=1 Tax=Aeribacillus sp. FSL K6-8394 TaxID=2954570 RepID=UPI0030F814D3
MNLLLQPKQYFLKQKPAKSIVGLVILLLFVSTVFLSLFILDILSDEVYDLDKQLATFVFIFLLTVPLYFILNFLITTLTSIILFFFNKHFVFRKMYIVILVYNAFILLVNSAALFLVITLNADNYFVIIQLISFLISTYFLRLLYYGIVSYAEGSRIGAVAIVTLYWIINCLLIIGGFLYG